MVKPNPDDRNINVDELVYYARTHTGWLNTEYRVGGNQTLLKKFIAAGIPVGPGRVADAIRAGEAAGTVRAFGTPAEEGGGGKIKLIEAGVFESAGDGPTSYGWLVYEDSFLRWAGSIGRASPQRVGKLL